jgi:hypothetical protein
MAFGFRCRVRTQDQTLTGPAPYVFHNLPHDSTSSLPVLEIQRRTQVMHAGTVRLSREGLAMSRVTPAPAL